jgi:hypothetical protein
MGPGTTTSLRKAGSRIRPRTSGLAHPCMHSSTGQQMQEAAPCHLHTSCRSSTHPNPRHRPSCTPLPNKRLVSTCSCPSYVNSSLTEQCWMQCAGVLFDNVVLTVSAKTRSGVSTEQADVCVHPDGSAAASARASGFE